MQELQTLIEGGGLLAVASVSLYFAITFLKMYRNQVNSHIKTLKLIARLPISEEDTLMRPPHETKAE